VIDSIHKSNPEMEIHFLTWESGLPILEGLNCAPIAIPRGLRLATFLNGTTYDYVIDLHGGVRSAIGGWRYVLPHPRGGIAHNYFEILKESGLSTIFPRARLEVNPTDAGRIAARIGDSAEYICISPFCRIRDKEWPVENYIQLIRRLTDSWKGELILVGSQADEARGEAFSEVVRSHHVLNWIGKTSLGEFKALLKGATLSISGDTGSMHIASALNTDALAIFGANIPEVGVPAAGNIYIIRGTPGESPYLKHPQDEMRSVSVDEVLEVTLRVLSGKAEKFSIDPPTESAMQTLFDLLASGIKLKNIYGIRSGWKKVSNEIESSSRKTLEEFQKSLIPITHSPIAPSDQELFGF